MEKIAGKFIINLLEMNNNKYKGNIFDLIKSVENIAFIFKIKFLKIIFQIKFGKEL